MITQSIKAPVIPTFAQTLMGRINQARTGVAHVQQHGPYKPRTIIGGLQRMVKEDFTKFIEDVKTKFKVGDFVCFAHFQPIADQLPGMIYRLEAINELWYDCVIDETSGQPRCVFIRGLMPGHSGFLSIPGTLRQLTEQEKQLVDLQNSPTHGTA